MVTNRRNNQRSKSVSQIYEELRGLILAGAFGAGARLSQMQLCQDLQVGRTPLREALRMLQQEGLIVAERNQRPRVVSFDAEVIDAHYAELILLSALAAAASIPHLTSSDVEALDALFQRMKAASAQSDVEGRNKADVAFHGRINAHATGPLRQTLRRISDAHRLYLRFFTATEVVPQKTIDEQHEAIIEACKARDAELGAKLIARHFAGAAVALLAQTMPEFEPRLVRAAMRLIIPTPELVTRKRAAIG
jgi:DNA-binding GntR family transcriptional regulator